MAPVTSSFPASSTGFRPASSLTISSQTLYSLVAEWPNKRKGRVFHAHAQDRCGISGHRKYDISQRLLLWPQVVRIETTLLPSVRTADHVAVQSMLGWCLRGTAEIRDRESVASDSIRAPKEVRRPLRNFHRLPITAHRLPITRR